MIRMTIEVITEEDIDPLYAHKAIAKYISLRLSAVDWVQQVKITNEL